jgi:hypothetical protein
MKVKFQRQKAKLQRNGGEVSTFGASENNIYLDVVGGISKKGTVWGLGELGPLLLKIESTSSSQATTHVDSNEVMALKTHVATLFMELGANHEKLLSYIQINN